MEELQRRRERPEAMTASLLAIVFSGPWGSVLADVASHGAYLDERTGESLQVFFAGVLPTSDHTWIPSVETIRGWYDTELLILTPPIRKPSDARDRWHRDVFTREGGWVWSPRAFDELRREVEAASDGRWQFSGNSDLVLANFLHGPGIEPAIDWESTITVALDRFETRDDGRWFGEIVESLTRACEDREASDPLWGMSELVDTDPEQLGGSAAARSLKYLLLQVLGPWIGQIGLNQVFRGGI